VFVFEKHKARKQEAERQQQAAGQRAQQQREAIQRLRGMAASLPDPDGVVSLEGFHEFFQVVIDNDVALKDFPDIRDPVLLGLAHGGYFLQCDTTLLLKKDEDALWVAPTKLLKEVTDREWRGGSRGVSIPIGGGVRYRAGATRGHMVTIGTHWATADSGMLTVTDQRVVYHGGRKTLEFPYKKLATLNVYTDAIDLGVTSRQTTSSFRLDDPALVAGMIRAAVDSDRQVKIIRVS
jgi:hypothetical protein